MEFSLSKYGFSFRFGRHSNGSGKSIISSARANAIAINPVSAESIYSIYKDYPIVFRIINDITDAIRNTPIWISNKQGEITDSSATKFKELNKKPNRYSKKGNFAADCGFELITFGRCFVVKRKYGSLGSEYYLLRNCDIEMVEYEYNFLSEKKVSKIKYREQNKTGYTVKELTDNIFELNLNYDTKENHSFHDSFKCPIVSVRSELQAYANMIAALDTNYGHGGAQKIISFKDNDGALYASTQTSKLKQELKDELKNDYGTNHNDDRHYITQQEVSVSDLSVPTQQLDVAITKPQLETSLCAAFKYPPQLMGVKTGAYKSQTEAEEAFYIRCVSPLANAIFQFLDEVFETNIDGNIELDYGIYDFFQDGKQKRGASIQTMMQGFSQAIELGVLTKEQCTKEILDIL